MAVRTILNVITSHIQSLLNEVEMMRVLGYRQLFVFFPFYALDIFYEL
jgi:cell division protein FtsX